MRQQAALVGRSSEKLDAAITQLEVVLEDMEEEQGVEEGATQLLNNPRHPAMSDQHVLPRPITSRATLSSTSPPVSVRPVAAPCGAWARMLRRCWITSQLPFEWCATCGRSSPAASARPSRKPRRSACQSAAAARGPAWWRTC